MTHSIVDTYEEIIIDTIKKGKFKEYILSFIQNRPGHLTLRWFQEALARVDKNKLQWFNTMLLLK